MADARHPPPDALPPVPPAPSPAPAPGYDTTRVSTRGVFWFILGFILAGALILPGIWWMEGAVIRSQHRAAAPIAEPLQLPQPLQPTPAHPQLPWQDMATLRAAQVSKLHSYGPAPDGHATIPIDRAMDLLLESGRLKQSWTNPATQPYHLETQPAPRVKPSVENRT